MHVFIPHNRRVRVRNDLTDSSPSQDAVLEAEDEAIVDAVKDSDFHVKRDFKKLLSTVALSAAQRKRREEAAALKKKIAEDAKLERQENAKKKKTDGATKTDGTDSENVEALQSISEAMTIMPNFCNLINRSLCKHESNGKYSIVLADLGGNAPLIRKWTPKKLDAFMGYLDQNSIGMFHQFF